MPKIVDTTTHPETGHVIVHYESGAQYDRDAGRLIHPATHAMITAETASMMQARRRELANDAAWDAANQTAIELVESGQLEYINRNQLGDAPAIAAVTRKVTTLLLTAKSGREAEGVFTAWLKLLDISGHKIEIEESYRMKELQRENRELTKCLMDFRDAMLQAVAEKDAKTKAAAIDGEEAQQDA
jgi:hypothetical protein